MNIAPLLASFLRRYRSSFPFELDGLSGGLAHIRYPSGYGSLLGSERGRVFWDTQEAKASLSAIMNTEPFPHWFESDSPLDQMEVKRALASLVGKWLTTNLSPEQFAGIYGREFEEDFALPEVKVVAYQIAYGLTLDSPYVELPFGFALSQAPPEAIANLLIATGNPPLRVIREPNLPALFLINTVVLHREEWRSIAAISAMGFAVTRLLRLRKAVWLNSDIVLGQGEVFYFQDSKYPAIGPEQLPALSNRVFWPRGNKLPMPQSSVQTLIQVLHRLAFIWAYFDDDGVDRFTIQPALDALEHAEAAMQSPSPRFAILMSCVGLECLLTREREEYTHVLSRVRQLISSDPNEQRQVRRALESIYKVRGKIAHGQLPNPRDLEKASGEAFLEESGQDRCWRTLVARCLALLRRAIVAYLFCTIDVAFENGAWSTSHPLNRDELLKMLDEAGRNNAHSKKRIREYVPDIARYPVLGDIPSAA